MVWQEEWALLCFAMIPLSNLFKWKIQLNRTLCPFACLVLNSLELVVKVGIRNNEGVKKVGTWWEPHFLKDWLLQSWQGIISYKRDGYLWILAFTSKGEERLIKEILGETLIPNKRPFLSFVGPVKLTAHENTINLGEPPFTLIIRDVSSHLIV